MRCAYRETTCLFGVTWVPSPTLSLPRSHGAHGRGDGLPSVTWFVARQRLVPKDATIIIDVGNATCFFGRSFEARGQAVLMSGHPC